MILADLFILSPDLPSFQEAVRALDGDFPFDAAAMIDLGTVYFARHPETARDRDMEAVLLGYGLVRACVVERIVRSLSPESRDFFRSVFQDASVVGRRLESRLSVEPSTRATPASGSTDSKARDVFRDEFLQVESELSALRAAIDEIPKGSIKERFVGGISHLYNVLYVVRLNLKNRGIMLEA
jgi:hypothetical protein